MELLTPEQRERMLANGRQAAAAGADAEGHDPRPVVKLFTPDGPMTWLLTELEEDGDTAFGLAGPNVVGDGSLVPEFGSVSLAQLAALRGAAGLPVERDLYWTAKHPISEYARLAREAGRVVD